MTRKFKDAALQQVYDRYIAERPASRAGRVGVSDFWRGYDHPDKPSTLAIRGSLTYAAWAAGVDTARRDAKGAR